MDELVRFLFPLSLLFFTVALLQQVAESKFTDTTYFTWGAQHSSILGNGDDLELVMVKTSGSAFESKSTYLFGSIEMMIKLVPGNSAGTNTAFYLSSVGEKHDEIDFEFLGGIEGKYYIVHTNIFVQGKGEREQEFFLWFDPTLAFHNYTIHWNPNEVVWFVDSVPIRIYRNYEAQGIPFPNKQGMKMHGSLWNADWATDGGRIKIDWKYAPFRAQFRNFRTRACSWVGPVSIDKCAVTTPANWFASASYNQLNPAKKYQMKRVRDKYMIYDYCKDGKRFNLTVPHECSKPQF